MMRSIQERVEAGSYFLDRNYLDWELKVDPVCLSMASNFRCVLGQLFGSYSVGFDRFELKEMQAAELGFVAVTRAEFPPLAEAWSKLIRDRQAAALDVGKPMTVDR